MSVLRVHNTALRCLSNDHIFFDQVGGPCCLPLHLFFCISSLLSLKGSHGFQKHMYGKEKILCGVNVPFPHSCIWIQTVWSQPLRSFISIIWSITQAKRLRSGYQRLGIGSGLQTWNLNASTAVLWCQYWVKEFMCNLALSSHNSLTWTSRFTYSDLWI